MIFVTGDTHGMYDFAKLKAFAAENKNLTKDDYVIIAGDCGVLFLRNEVEEMIKAYSELPFTVLFIDGNHENFRLLNEYPVEHWHGGKVHIIRPDIIHLMRGQVFESEGKRIFTFGGATSIDKCWREEGIDWWAEELPTYEEMDEGLENLKRVNNEVDYIITHSCDERALYYPPLSMRLWKKEVFKENQILNIFEERVKYKHWYFGHYHMDGDLTDKKTVLYQEIRELK